MIKIIGAVLVLLLAVPSEELTQSKPVSPCPNVFKYDVINNGKWFGILTLTADKPTFSLWLNIVLDSRADTLGNWVGDSTTVDNMNFKIENSSLAVEAGKVTTIPFFVEYNTLKAMPLIKVIRYNGIEICNADRPVSSTAASQGVQPQPLPLGTPIEEPECGRPAPNPLIFYGTSAKEGEWPWQTAIYWSEESGFIFKCGGSLVTLSHIVTAAHCITNLKTDALVPKEIVTIVLGKYNLMTSITGSQFKAVERLEKHPKFNKDSLKHDLGMIKLESPAQYSRWVRPVCLPPDGAEESFYGSQFGTVVGWGLTESYRLSSDLKTLEVPIIDSLNCVLSNPSFYSTYINLEGTAFCAGYQNGSSPCNGDSGSGLVTAVNKVWYLRGVVSVSVIKNSKCDPDQYVVFTDVCKMLPLIKRFIAES